MIRLWRKPLLELFVFIALLLVLRMMFLLPAYGDGDNRAREIKMGREAAVEIEKDNKLVTDPKVTEWVQRLGQALAAIANSEPVQASYGSSEVYQFEYVFKVIEDDSVNAFSLPGGIIYVNTGLLDYVESDHELAGVLAHEIAHASHHHMSRLLREQNKLDSSIGLLLLAGMLTKVDACDLGNIMLGAQLVRIAKASGYGQKAEADADATAVVYTVKAGYNPVGALTFLERLARDYGVISSPDLGILQTHPAPKDRCLAAMTQIKRLGLPINRRAVTDCLKAVTETAVVNGQELTRVKLAGEILFDPAPIGSVLTSVQRANATATEVNQFLDSEPMMREVTVSPDGRSVLARGKPVIIVTPEDSTLQAKADRELAESAANVLRRAIWQETVSRMY